VTLHLSGSDVKEQSELLLRLPTNQANLAQMAHLCGDSDELTAIHCDRFSFHRAEKDCEAGDDLSCRGKNPLVLM
jgi:hypothetical protein